MAQAKDMFNREINIGDLVAGASSYNSLAAGIVTSFTPKGMIRVFACGGALNHHWSALIRCPSRCMIIDYRSIPADRIKGLLEEGKKRGLI